METADKGGRRIVVDNGDVIYEVLGQHLGVFIRTSVLSRMDVDDSSLLIRTYFDFNDND